MHQQTLCLKAKRKTEARTAGRRHRILVVDRPGVMRMATARWIGTCPAWEVCGEAGNAARAIKAIKQLKPDLVVTELMPVRNFEFLCKLRARFPKLRILLFAGLEEEWFDERAREAGANGFVSKHDNPDKLITGIRTLLKSKRPRSNSGSR